MGKETSLCDTMSHILLLGEPMAKKREYEVVPGVGIGPLQLGMSRKDVFAALGKRGVAGKPPDEFFQNCLQVEYKKGKVVFIQVSCDAPFNTHYKKKDIFGTKASQLLKQLGKDGEVVEDEPGCSYQFPSLNIVLWREADPDELKSELKQLKRSDGDYEDRASFYKSEIERFSYFETVGVFADGYYD